MGWKTNQRGTKMINTPITEEQIKKVIKTVKRWQKMKCPKCGYESTGIVYIEKCCFCNKKLIEKEAQKWKLKRKKI